MSEQTPAQKLHAVRDIAEQLDRNLPPELRLAAAVWLAAIQIRRLASQGKVDAAVALVGQATEALDKAVSEGLRDIGQRN